MKMQISYADDVYKKAQIWNARMAKWFGKFDEIKSYNPSDLSKEFKENNASILSQSRGGGYWIWKSYCICDALERIQVNDYLFYCDAGAVFIKPVDKLIRVMERDKQEIMLFEIFGHKERYWTKRDVFLFLEHDINACRETNQIMAGFILIKKTEYTVEFFKKYLEVCQYKKLITDAPNELGELNFQGFQDHRHDGSILSVMAKKAGIKPYRDPSQWGSQQKILYRRKIMNTQEEYEVFERSNYPCMIYLHRYKEINLKNILCSFRDTVKNYCGVFRNKSR